MSAFLDSLLERETVASFGIDMSLWGEEEQAELREVMTLVMEEHPEWTEESVKKECQKQVDRILFEWFYDTLGVYVKKSRPSSDIREAYAEFRKTTLKLFLKKLKEDQEFQDFCDEFYEDLRDLWNICSAGMYDEYQHMKKKNWTFLQYRNWLTNEMKRIGNI